MNQNNSGDNQQVTKFNSEVDLAAFVNKNYIAQLKNFFGDEKQAMKFLSSMRASVQKLPKLLECEPSTVVNSFMTMAQLGLMPSDVSGEAYVLPYKGKAQFQLGYQGLVTLFYRAGGESIRADIIRAKDEFSYINGIINHKVNIFMSNEERGEPVGAYAIAVVNGQEIAKAMNKKDILGMAKNFSQSFSSDYSPWKVENDPELWMWKKTVLKQLGKLLPKNETINKAIALDNQESRLAKVEGLLEESTLKIGDLDKANGDKNKGKGGSQKETGAGAAGGSDKDAK